MDHQLRTRHLLQQQRQHFQAGTRRDARPEQGAVVYTSPQQAFDSQLMGCKGKRGISSGWFWQQRVHSLNTQRDASLRDIGWGTIHGYSPPNSPCWTTCTHIHYINFDAQPGHKNRRDCRSNRWRKDRTGAVGWAMYERGLEITGQPRTCKAKSTIQLEWALIHRTDCILIISWPGRHRSVRSRISMGSPTKQDMVLMGFVAGECRGRGQC